jgi:hypothetical protein
MWQALYFDRRAPKENWGGADALRAKADAASAEAKTSSDENEQVRLFQLCEELHWKASQLERGAETLMQSGTHLHSRPELSKLRGS